MRKFIFEKVLQLVSALILLASLLSLTACGTPDKEYTGDFSVKTIIEPTAEYPNTSKVIACFDGEIAADTISKDVFAVSVMDMAATIDSAYLCNEDGEKTNCASRYVAFELSNAPSIMASKGAYNTFRDSYEVSVKLKDGKEVKIDKEVYTELSVIFNSASNYICHATEDYVKDSFLWEGEGKSITLQRAFYTPEQAKTDGGKNPLIIWLHGLGEGGTDINIPLLKDNMVALSSPAVQMYFTTDTQKGAYVAAIQCPTFWLDKTGSGSLAGLTESFTGNGQPSYYTEALVAAIDDYLEGNADIDTDRIYLAGCSNGGYMVMNLAVDYGDKFAAYVPLCEGYMNGNITDKKINELKNRNIWFVQSDDDATVKPFIYTIPTYYRLIDTGAQNVKFTLLTGYGHGCWTQFFADNINKGFDNELVKENFADLIFNDDGSLAEDSVGYVCSKNCTVDEGSVFAWLAKQSLN